MSTKTIDQMPVSKKIIKSPHELNFIRERLSGIFESKVNMNDSQLAILELIFCLANEIDELKKKISDMQLRNRKLK